MSLNEFLSTQQSALLKKQQASEVLQSGGKQQKEVYPQVNKQEPTILVSPSQYENQFGDDMIMPTVNQTQINAERDSKLSQAKKKTRLNRKNALIMQEQDITYPQYAKIKGEKVTPNGRILKYSKQVQINKLKVSVLERKQALMSSPESERIKQMQEKIKLIAKTIRQKVRKDGEKQINHIYKQKKNRILQNPKQMRRLQNRSIALSPLAKQPISADNAIQNQSTLITSLQHQLKTVDPRIIVKDIVRNDILGSMWKAIQIQQKLNKYKLKLDPIKHRYPLTSFRKAILEQCKQLGMEQEKKIKEREEKLIKRKMIYNSSRFDRYIKQEKGKQSLSRSKQTKIIENQSETVIDQITAKAEEHFQNPEVEKEVKIEEKDILSLMANNLDKKEGQQIQKIKQDNQEAKQTRLESDEQEYYF